jgi:transcriptional regulator with XRE-family HTH domain
MKIVDFAKQIGISQGSLSDIENEKTKPSAETLSSIVRNTDIDATWLLTGGRTTSAPARAAPDPVSEKVLLMLEAMSEEKKREVLKYTEERKQLIECQSAVGRRKAKG